MTLDLEPTFIPMVQTTPPLLWSLPISQFLALGAGTTDRQINKKFGASLVTLFTTKEIEIKNGLGPVATAADRQRLLRQGAAIAAA